MQKVRNKVNELIAENREVKTIVKGTVVCINELREQQQRLQSKINELVDKALELKNASVKMIKHKMN